MFTEANAGLQSLKVISDFLSANKSLRNYNEIVVAVSEVSSKLESAYSMINKLRDENSSLINQLAELREKVSRQETFDRDFARYSLHKLESGSIVYRVKPEYDSEEYPTYICADCARKQQIVFMNTVLNGTRLVCDSCKKNVDTGWKPGSHKTPK